jgi:hypothetical protein
MAIVDLHSRAASFDPLSSMIIVRDAAADHHRTRSSVHRIR